MGDKVLEYRAWQGLIGLFCFDYRYHIISGDGAQTLLIHNFILGNLQKNSIYSAESLPVISVPWICCGITNMLKAKDLSLYRKEKIGHAKE